MRHRKKAVILLVLLLLLSSCGSGEAERLEEENETLQKQVTALEEEKDALQKQVTATEKEKDELQKQIDSLQTELELEQLRGEEISRENNPIDRFYDSVETSGSTYEMAGVAGVQGDAWEVEARNLAEQLKAQLYFQEDLDLVDAYLATAEKQVEYMCWMAMYPVSDLEVPQADRLMFSGTLVKVLWPQARAEIWRDTFFQLYRATPGSVIDDDYAFIFDAEAAQQELDKWMK